MSDVKSIEELFGELIGVAPEDRKRFLDQACGEDTQLRGNLENLLQSHERAGSFLEDDSAMESTLSAVDDGSASAQVGPYKLLQKIGEGGMGAVYMAATDAAVEPPERNRYSIAMASHVRGLLAVASGSRDAANKHFQVAVSKPHGYLEWYWSEAFLRRLESDEHWPSQNPNIQVRPK